MIRVVPTSLESNPNFVIVDGDEEIRFGGAPFRLFETLTELKRRRTRFREITDGLSRTMLFSETVKGNGRDQRGYTWWGYAAGYTSFLSPNSNEADRMQSLTNCDLELLDQNPPCDAPTGPSLETRSIAAARSRHPGGVQVVMCDGSGKFVSDNVDIQVWRGSGSTRGEEVVADL